MNTVTLSVDTTEVQALIAEAEALIAQSPDWLRWLASEAFEHLQSHIDLFAIDQEFSAASNTDELRIGAQPTDQFRLLVAALRAGNGQPCGLVDFHAQLERLVRHD